MDLRAALLAPQLAFGAERELIKDVREKLDRIEKIKSLVMD
jgi:hypothetical protein